MDLWSLSICAVLERSSQSTIQQKISLPDWFRVTLQLFQREDCDPTTAIPSLQREGRL